MPRKSPSGKKKRTTADLKKYYKQWLTYQLSDHRPLWVRINTNDTVYTTHNVSSIHKNRFNK